MPLLIYKHTYQTWPILSGLLSNTQTLLTIIRPVFASVEVEQAAEEVALF